MIQEDIQILLDDTRVSDVLKLPVREYLNKQTSYDSKEDVTKYIQNYNEYILKDYSYLKESVEYLKETYSEIYNVNELLYDNIYKIVVLYDILNGLWLKMADDRNIPPVFSKLVAFWLSNYRYDLVERQKLAKEIVDEIRNGNAYENLEAIKRIKIEYVKLYKFKRTFFDGLYKEFEGINNQGSKESELSASSEIDGKKAGGFLGLFKRKNN